MSRPTNDEITNAMCEAKTKELPLRPGHDTNRAVDLFDNLSAKYPNAEDRLEATAKLTYNSQHPSELKEDTYADMVGSSGVVMDPSTYQRVSDRYNAYKQRIRIAVGMDNS